MYFSTPEVYICGDDAQDKLALPVKNALDTPPDTVVTIMIDPSMGIFGQETERSWPNKWTGKDVKRNGGGIHYQYPNGTPHRIISYKYLFDEL